VAAARRTPGRQRRGEVEVRVAVDRAVAEELRGGKARDHPEHAALLAGAELRLEADEVPHLARAVLAPELDHGVRRAAGPRVAEPDGLHRPVAQGIDAAGREHLDGKAALEVRSAVVRRWRFPALLEADVLPVAAGIDVGGAERFDEGDVLLAVQRAVEVVLAPAL